MLRWLTQIYVPKYSLTQCSWIKNIPHRYFSEGVLLEFSISGATTVSYRFHFRRPLPIMQLNGVPYITVLADVVKNLTRNHWATAAVVSGVYDLYSNKNMFYHPPSPSQKGCLFRTIVNTSILRPVRSFTVYTNIVGPAGGKALRMVMYCFSVPSGEESIVCQRCSINNTVHSTRSGEHVRMIRNKF